MASFFNQISNSFLIESIYDGNDDDFGNLPSKHNKVIGLFHGTYQLISRPPPTSLLSQQSTSSIILTQHPIRLIPFSHYSETDELAEFRLLNHKDRVIVRCSLEGYHSNNSSDSSSSMVWFGYEPEKKRYFTFDINGILVFRGPVSLLIYDRNQNRFGESNQTEYQQQQMKYNGHLTLNLIGHSMIDFSGKQNQQPLAQIYLLPSCDGQEWTSTHTRFIVDSRTIPYRFQQKTIVQRQRNMLQNSTGTNLMSLETFDHLLY